MDYMDDISFSKRRKNRGYTYLCAGSVICVSLLRAPQYSTFACCLIPVLTLVVLLVMLDDIDDISFSKRRYFLIVSWTSISVYCIPTWDTHITRDMCMGIHISRGYTYHCDTGVTESRSSVYINIKRTRMDWSFLLLISPIKHQGQCFPLLLIYPSAKFRISTPNRFSKTCDVNMRSCKFLRQIFHLKKLA